MSIDRNIYVGPIVVCKVPKKAPDVSDLGIFGDLMDVWDTGWPKTEQVFVPNISAEYSPRPYHIDDLGSFRHFTSPRDRDDDKAWVVTKYKKALAKLTQAYGEGNVRIEWGVLRWSQ